MIAAHNATWFRHIDQLKKGSAIEVKTDYGEFLFHVTGSKIVHTGEPVYNTPQQSIVLEACYPLNALYLTPYRYLVFAKMDETGKWKNTQQQSAATIYKAAIPQHLRSEGLTLSTNTLPMGTMKYTDQPSKVYTESPSPLSASNALVQSYLAWLHASSNKELDALQSLIPFYQKDSFFGTALSQISYDSSFDEILDVYNGKLRSITGVVHPYIKGLGHFKVTMTAKVRKSVLTIVSLDIKKAK